MLKWRFNFNHRMLVLAPGVIFSCSATANAQSNVQSAAGGSNTEIVVTATKRAQSVQQVPFTITALGQKDLTARGALSAEQAIAYVPGVNFSSNGTNSGTYSIRGVNTATLATNTQSPVGLYIDDFNVLDPSFPRVTTDLRLFDVNRVEVLEGPQGTLFGSGSLGGAIRLITNKPDLSHFQAETEDTISGIQGGGLNYDVNLMVNVPLVEDKLALRAVGYYERSGGYVDNIARNEQNVNHSLSKGGRLELKWVPTPRLTLLATALIENDIPHDSAYSFYGSKKYEWDGLVATPAFNKTRIYSLSANYGLNWATLTSITTYADRYENIVSDFSADSLVLLGINAASPLHDEGPSRTFSQEVRLASPDTGRFRWLVGGIYIDNRREVLEPLIVPGSGPLFGSTSDLLAFSGGKGTIREAAIFGEVSYDILPHVTATAGLRVFNDRSKNTQVAGGTVQPPSTQYTDIKETSETPKFNLTYHLNPSSLIYFQAAEGYRIGQANSTAEDPFSHQVVPLASSPDKLWNYEVGEKTTLFGGHLVVNLGLYFIDWRNIQLDERTVPSGILFIGNAGHAHIKGVELEVRSTPLRDWEVGGALSLSDSRLVSVDPTASATEGDRLPGSAPINFNLYAQYTYPVSATTKVFGRIDGRYVGKEYSTLMNETSLTYGRYATINLRAGANWSRYSLSAFIENAANNDGKISSFSKYYSMAGWRLGWLVVPDKLIDAARARMGNLFLTPPSLAQHAGLVAFDCHEELEGHIGTYARNRALLLNALPAMGLRRIAPPDGAFYVYADVAHMTEDSLSFCEKLLRDTGVATAPGVDFDPVEGHGFMRFSFAVSTNLVEDAIARITPWFASRQTDGRASP